MLFFMNFENMFFHLPLISIVRLEDNNPALMLAMLTVHINPRDNLNMRMPWRGNIIDNLQSVKLG